MKQKLLTQELLKEFKKRGVQTETTDPVVVAKFFSPYTGWTWYATEYDEVDEIFYGYVEGNFCERGSFSLEELSMDHPKFPGLQLVERDRWFTPTVFSKLTKRTDG